MQLQFPVKISLEIEGPIRCYIRTDKRNVLPTTLPRISWNTSTILKLPRCLHHMKYYLLTYLLHGAEAFLRS